MTAAKLAIVTPCYKEGRDTLNRMMRSVIAQTQPCHHIMVSDGVQRAEQELLGKEYLSAGHQLTLINLPFRTNNSGAAPRAIGAAWAFSLGIPLVSFLDADNALLPGHVSAVLKHDDSEVAAITTSRRVFLKDTGEETPIEPGELTGQHVDTNCLTLTRRATHLLPIWLYWPTAFGTGEDRIFSAILNGEGGKVARTAEQTVLYWSEWPIHYQLAGKPVPVTARRPSRRAATHFHAPSFFAIVGRRPIASQWLRLKSRPIPALSNTPFIVQDCPTLTADATSLRMKPVSIACADLIITRRQILTNEVMPTFLINQKIYGLPNGAPLCHGLALSVLSAYHQGHGRLVLFLESALNRTEKLHHRIVTAVAQMQGQGLVFFFRADGGDRSLFAIGATTHLGILWGDVVTQSAPAQTGYSVDSPQALYDRLASVCTRHGVAMAEREVL